MMDPAEIAERAFPAPDEPGHDWMKEIRKAARERDRAKPVKPTKLETYINNETRRESREQRQAEDHDRKQALRSKFERDLWDSLGDADAKRFAALNINADPDKPMLKTVPQKQRHAAIVAMMYHVGQYYRQKGKLTPETAPEKLQAAIYNKIKPLQAEIAIYRTKYGDGRAYKDPGPIKPDDELLRLAGVVARSVLERPWTQDIDACKRGGKQSGRVRRDRAETTSWAEVRLLAESINNKAEIARQVGISRQMVYKILSTPGEWGRSKSVNRSN